MVDLPSRFVIPRLDTLGPDSALPPAAAGHQRASHLAQSDDGAWEKPRSWKDMCRVL